jgi:hypothetical protein
MVHSMVDTEQKTINAIKAWQHILEYNNRGFLIASREAIREELIRLWNDLYIIRCNDVKMRLDKYAAGAIRLRALIRMHGRW